MQTTATSTGGRIPLASGARLSVPTPNPAEIRIEDVAYGLAGQYRWGGHSRPRVTVAEHCILVERLAAVHDMDVRLRRLALLHDAAEGLGLGDCLTPVKALLPGYRMLEDRFLDAVWKAVGLDPPTAAEAEILKALDRVAGSTERRDLFADARDPAWGNVAQAHPDLRVAGWPPHVAEARYLEAWRRLQAPQTS